MDNKENKVMEYILRRIFVFVTGLSFILLSKIYLQELEVAGYWILFTIGIAAGRLAFIGLK